jgi:repressor LexA
MFKTKTDTTLAFIESYIEERGYPPSYREIAKGVGLASTGSVSDQLNRLVSEGRLSLTPGVARGMRVLHGNGNKEAAPSS